MSDADPTKFYLDSQFLDWLQPHCTGWQFGEQGLLTAIANLIGGVGRAVEIGAGDGETLPLTIEPFYNGGVPCLLFEEDEQRQAKLREKFFDAEICGKYTSNTWQPYRNELVVIDIDSFDSEVMRQVLASIGKSVAVLMVEHFDMCHVSQAVSDQPVPSWLLGKKLSDGFTIQDTAPALLNIANQFGFKRVGLSRVNSVFVRSDLYPLLCKPVAVSFSGAGA
jgi:hypothetical protein